MEKIQLRIQEMLLENHGKVDVNLFSAKYKKKYRQRYKCPTGSHKGDPQSLKECIPFHCMDMFTVCSDKCTTFICAKTKNVELTMNKNVPSTSDAVKTPPATVTDPKGFLHNNNGDTKVPTKNPKLPFSSSSTKPINAWGHGFSTNLLPSPTISNVARQDPNFPLLGAESIPAQLNQKSAEAVKSSATPKVGAPSIAVTAKTSKAKKQKTYTQIPIEPSTSERNKYQYARKGYERTEHTAPSPATTHRMAPTSVDTGQTMVKLLPDKPPVLEFDLEESHIGGLPTLADVNQRVDDIRSRLSKSGIAVDFTNLTRKLCEYYHVRSVQNLKCSDQRRMFTKEIHIEAISNFSKCYCKVLCYIHCYCTSTTIATLHDLERFICEKEGKDSFLDLKLGPLQKFPLVYHYFKFPSDMEIKKLTAVDIMKSLWRYCGKFGKGKQVVLEEFLTYLANNSGFENPYELGIKVNSIALAIQVVKRVNFGDMDRMNRAKESLLADMDQDLNDYIRKLRRGITGLNRQVLPGQPANIVQKIAGMHIEDAIMSIFHYAKDCKTNVQRKMSMTGLFTPAQRILETMTFFQSRPVLSKFFHVIVATGTFRTLGLEDEQLLKMLGYKDSLKRMTEEQVLERYPDVISRGSSTATSPKTFKHIHEANVKKELHNWLDKSPKPIDLKTLGNIELRVVQSLDPAACGFESIGQETFLAFLTSHKELHKYLGNSIIVDSLKVQDDENTAVSSKQIEEFVLQCGQGKNKRDVLMSIHRQFPETRYKLREIDDVISHLKQDDCVQSSQPLTYLYSLCCGFDQSDEASKNEETVCDQLKTGYLGSFSSDDAIKCLMSAPLLEDLSTWSNWALVFEPQFGELRSFLRKQDKVHAIEAAPNVYLKISLDSTTDNFKSAIDAHNPCETAGHLLSIIFAGGGLTEAPLIHLANIMKSSLASKVGDLTRCEGTPMDQSIERFVLQCMLRIPANFCSSIAMKVFLSPLNEIFGDGQGCESVPATILAACRSSTEKSYLHALGALLAVEEWIADFRDNQFTVKPPKPERQEAIDIEIEKLPSDVEYQKEACQLSEAAHVSKVVEIQHESEATLVEFSKEMEEKTLQENSLDESSDTGSLDFDEADKEILEMETRLQHCRDLVDEIRRNEFGKGKELGELEAKLIQKGNERLCRSLNELSKGLYANDTHFVLELIQNADDNTYDDSLFEEGSVAKPSVAFIVDQTQVIVLNNERGFQDKDIRAICDVGKSTKGAHRKGYIGQKGIGFKSVFRVTDCPEIHSNGFHIRFDARHDSMGYILPDWHDAGDFSDLTEYSPSQFDDLDLDWKTQINLPLKKEIMGSNKTSARFQDIHPSLLLFLNRLSTIVVDNKINNKCLVMKKRSQGPNLVELTQNGVPSLWFVVTSEIDTNARDKRETTEVSLAFPLDDGSATERKNKALPMQSVFAFLPLRSYGFKFLIQADFEVPSNRSDVDRDSSWNQAILQEIPRLVVEAFFKFRDRESTELMSSDPITSATRLFQFLPLEGEIVQGVFRPVARKILQLLQKEKCIPVVGDGEGDEANTHWTIPSEVLLGDSTLKKIITPAELRRYLNLNYMSTVMQKHVSSALLTALGVQAESLDHLMEISKSHLKVISEEMGKSQQTVEWLGKWFLCVCEYLERKFDSSQESLAKIRNAAVFPLSNGSIVNLKEVAVFFTPASKKTTSSTTQRQISQLMEDLNTLDNNLLNGLTTIDQLKVKRLLTELGVKQMCPKAIINDHVISAFQKGQWKEHLLCPYLVYMKEQYSIDASIIDLETLKKCVVLKTNNGHVQPSEKQVYFTEMFGNSIDLKAVFPCFKWTLISPDYMQGSKSKDFKPWQQFLTKLGVAHFPKMKRKTIRIESMDLSESVWWQISRNWPVPEDQMFEIDDLICEEFDAILDSKDRGQLCSLAQELDLRWRSHFSHVQSEGTSVRDSAGNQIAVTFCSTFIKLKSSCWLPKRPSSLESNSESQICAPKDLYLHLPIVQSVLGDFCPYFDGEIKDDSFIDAIGIKTRVSIDEVFKYLEMWSTCKDFKTSLNHMTAVYTFINSHIPDVDHSEFDKRVIFVPSANKNSKGKDRESSASEIVRGTFRLSKDVCLYDHSTMIIRHGQLFPNKRHLMFRFYPKDILQFFKEHLKVDETPNLREYFEMAYALTEDIRLPDKDAVEDLMKVLSILGRKCLNVNPEDLNLQWRDGISTMFANLRDSFDKTKSNFLLSLVKEENLLPTNRGKFISVDNKPLIADSEQDAEIFSEKLSFLELPVLFRTWMEERRLSSQHGGDEKKHVVGLLAYFALCNVKLLSEVVCPVEIIPENSEIGSYKWNKKLCQLLPYIQRYLFYKEKVLYDDLTNGGIVAKLKGVVFFTVNNLTATHRIKGDDSATVTKPRKIALEDLDTSTHVQIRRDCLEEKDEIINEFLTLFVKQNPFLQETLCDFLQLLASDSSSIQMEKHCQKKKIGLLPDAEERWRISEPVERRITTSRQNSSAKVEDFPMKLVEDSGNPSGNITCWPPPMPNTGGGMARKAGNITKPHEERWQAPAPPESMPRIEKGMPNFKDNTEGQQISNDRVMRRQVSSSSENASSVTHGRLPANKAPLSPRMQEEMQGPIAFDNAVLNPGIVPNVPSAQVNVAQPNRDQVISGGSGSHTGTMLPTGDHPPDEVAVRSGDDAVSAESHPKDMAHPIPVVIGQPDETATTFQPLVASQYPPTAAQHLFPPIPGGPNGVRYQTVPLECTYENIEVDKLGEWAQDLVLDENSSTDSEQVGRIGEQIVFDQLKKQYAATHCTVTWRNENRESGAPYDIVIETTNNNNNRTDNSKNTKEYRFVEVKGTKSGSDKPFEISSQELRCAFDYPENYDIYRVSGITAGLSSINIKRLAGLARFLDQKAVKVFIAFKNH